MTAELSRKAQEAAAAALATPFARRISEGIASVTNKKCDNSEGFAFLDSMCGPMMDKFRNAGDEDDDDDSVVHGGRGGRGGDRGRSRRSGRRPQSSYDYGDDETEYTDDDYDDDTYDDGGTPRKRRGGRRGRGHSRTDDESSYTTGYTGYTDDDTFDNNTYGTRSSASRRRDDDTYDSAGKLIQKPLASGFAKRCYFTKAGIGRNTQHYEGLTLTGNTILMLASAMKMKGCPTICDEDLRTVEQTFPNQFSRLPDELLLSSGWRRISKYCHFSHKPLPDGVPFFHSRKRCHPNGGFYFLLCSAVGMVRNIDVEPLSRDALVLLQTDFPLTCEKAPQFLVEDPSQWTLVNKFCYFSGGPINVEEDVYYKADLGGNEICMLAFLSPNLTPEELYRLKESPNKKPGEEENTGPLKSVKAVEEVESVYNLTNQDFDDLKLYHLGPCRALPPHLLTPDAWTKVLPPPFATAREEALMIAQDWESRFPPVQPAAPTPAPIEEKKVENITSGYVEFGETAQMKQPTLSQDPSENYNQQPQMQLQHMQSGSSHEYPTQYPSKQIQQPMGQEQHNYSQQYPAQVHQINGIMRDPNGQYQPQATFPAQYPPHQLSSALQASTDHISPQGNMPQLEMEVANAHPPTDPNNFVREVEEGTGWDQPHDEAYIPNPRRVHQLDPEYSSLPKIREDPPDALSPNSNASLTITTMGESSLKQLAMQRMESKSPNRSLASKLAARRAMLLSDDEDTIGDSTVATSLVSESTTDLSLGEKNSRRALILQMAKARMKSLQKEKVPEEPAEGKAEGRNESPPKSTTPEEHTEDPETSRDEILPIGGVSSELSTGLSGLELD